MFRFTIRELMWLAVLAALGISLGAGVAATGLRFPRGMIDRQSIRLLVLIGLPIAAAILQSSLGAAFLRAACHLFNRIVAQEHRVYEPSYSYAFFTMAMVCVTNFVLGACLAGPLSFWVHSKLGMPTNDKHIEAIATLATFPLSFLAFACVLSFRLPCPLSSAFRVAAIFLGLTLLVVLPVILIAVCYFILADTI